MEVRSQDRLTGLESVAAWSGAKLPEVLGADGACRWRLVVRELPRHLSLELADAQVVLEPITDAISNGGLVLEIDRLVDHAHEVGRHLVD